MIINNISSIIGNLVVYAGMIIFLFSLVGSTIWHIHFLFVDPFKKNLQKADRIIEILTVTLGLVPFLFWMGFMINIQLGADWSKQLFNSEMHSPIASESFLTLAFIIVLVSLAYAIVNFVPANKNPPLVCVLCISMLYIGAGLCVIWCAQITPHLTLWIYPGTCFIIILKTIRNIVARQGEILRQQDEDGSKLLRIFNKVSLWPYFGFILALPIIGIIIAFLTLFGQRPDSVIRAWTETADWNFSQKIPPQNIFRDEHYLCTVAAGGHKEIVRPIRTGKRHGNRVIVNRQLLVANAFEQLLQERIPKIHKFIRSNYDKYGYPIAKHIKSKYIADIIYIIMKPLEWSFLIILYLFDSKPENRIAVQYPHKQVPGINID